MYKQFVGIYSKNIRFCNPSAKFEEMFSVTHYGAESVNAALI